MNVSFAAPPNRTIADLRIGDLFAHIDHEGTVRAFVLLELVASTSIVANLTDHCVGMLAQTERAHSARVLSIEVPYYLGHIVGHAVDVTTGDEPPVPAAAPASPPMEDATSIDAGAVSGETSDHGRQASTESPLPDVPPEGEGATLPPRHEDLERATDADVEADALRELLDASADGYVDNTATDWADELGRDNARGIVKVLEARARTIGAEAHKIGPKRYRVVYP